MRWLVLAVLTCITILNYIDRQAVTILFQPMSAELHLPEGAYATLVTIFLYAYTGMYAVGGWLVDRLGARNGLALALAWWSLATAATAATKGKVSLEWTRLFLAVAQPLVFPAGVKMCAELFPASERAMATGIFSAGSGVGALIAAPLLAGTALQIGWRNAMLLPAVAGLLLVPCWMAVYREKPQMRAAAKVSAIATWGRLLRERSAWALILPRSIGDSLWYFCFFWIPTFLSQSRHLDLKSLAMFGWIPFLFADIGSILGGSLSDALVRRGITPVRARLGVLIAFGIITPLGGFIGAASSLWLVILLLGLLAFASQCWSTNTVALAADLTPTEQVGSLVGLMGTAGGLGGALFSQITGSALRHAGFGITFVFAGLLLPVAISLLLALLPAEKRAAKPMSQQQA